MKKTLSALLALLFCGMAVLMTACTPPKKYQQKVLDYLTEEYPGKTFELTSFKQNKETSGRYEVSASCNEDGTKFDIYVYSTVFLTDGYSVVRANKRAAVLLREKVVGTDAFEYIADIRWLRIYNEDSTDYSFRHVDNVEELTAKDITSVDTVTFNSPIEASDAEKGIRATVNAFDAAGMTLESVGFEFTVGYKSCRLTTDSASVANASDGEIAEYIASELSSTEEVSTLWLSVSGSVVDMEFEK